ncbi:uncharacterized protein LOC115447373 [Manduca sexta]|uniref:BZIP domain-containing protein n=1 Tax=Manduca sexta TaxID=7130 RepID=A0A921YMK2_MANSE|nr:uncharacterized protein LOC115447373 [Manduca sexta]XP_030030275.1 uncharacterized protein LOC115447373 [Manduca sexta]KAG6441779.1 hypothetical protein O3G_MSEX001945 [Manduca sexta]
MVFSQTSHKTQSLLKVVELDRLKPEKSLQANGLTGVVTDGNTGAMPTSPVPTTSYSEEYLKPEPLFDDTMFQNEPDCEFFQDLVQWCSAPAKEEQVQTIDPPKNTEERAYNIDTPQTPFSPHGWDAFDVNSPYYQAGFYNTTPVEQFSSNIEAFGQYTKPLPFPEEQAKVPMQEQFLDIVNLPVVIGDLTSSTVPDRNTWQAPDPVEWTHTHDTHYTKVYNTNTHNTMPLIDQEDSLDSKFVSVIPREVESNNVFISEFIINDDRGKGGLLQEPGVPKRSDGLTVDVRTHAPNWPADIISTPEVLSYVEQMEKEKYPHPSLMKLAKSRPVQEPAPNIETSCTQLDTPPRVDYDPITPKSESHVESDNDDSKSHSSRKRHHDSEDSDETYTPYIEQPSRKYKRRKPSVPIKDMIIALEGSQQLTRARRGRPPKRRESTVSSVCSVDENSSSISTQETKYRELRDKNNEASKRSRMNRKLKELQMEQLVIELEERNKKLKVKADILEEMTKKLKDALMTAILQK